MNADTITSARFTQPTTRYPHGVLGDEIEYGALELTVEKKQPPQNATEKGSTGVSAIVTITLPESRVFEDLIPRLVDIDQNGTMETVVVESHSKTGAQLAIYDAAGDRIAATPHIGTRFRWLAPVGAADIDGDGHIEIAYVDRPHLAKTLRIWRFRDNTLTEIASLPDLTNHRIGEDFISGGLRDCGTGPELILANTSWTRIMAVTFNEGWQKTDLGPINDAQNLATALNC